MPSLQPAALLLPQAPGGTQGSYQAYQAVPEYPLAPPPIASGAARGGGLSPFIWIAVGFAIAKCYDFVRCGSCPDLPRFLSLLRSPKLSALPIPRVRLGHFVYWPDLQHVLCARDVVTPGSDWVQVRDPIRVRLSTSDEPGSSDRPVTDTQLIICAALGNSPSHFGVQVARLLQGGPANVQQNAQAMMMQKMMESMMKGQPGANPFAGARDPTLLLTKRFSCAVPGLTVETAVSLEQNLGTEGLLVSDSRTLELTVT